MKYGDFSSLVQLGVGLHAGTALLQLYGEIGPQPLNRRVGRIRALLEDQPDHEMRDELTFIESQLDIFAIRYFNEYLRYVFINSGVAILLALTLVVISYRFDHAISDGWAVFVVAVSLLPAPVTLGILWWGASKQMKPIKERAKRLEDRALGRTLRQ
jgi:hypothetical protein